MSLLYIIHIYYKIIALNIIVLNLWLNHEQKYQHNVTEYWEAYLLLHVNVIWM